MRRITVSQASERIGEDVELRGWVSNRRSSGKIAFLQLRDGSGVIQCVFALDCASKELIETVGRLPYESSVIVRGELKADARSPLGVELLAKGLSVIHEAEPYPISKKEHGPGFLMDHRHLWLRSSRQTALIRLRAVLTRAARSFFDELGFVAVEAPILTPTSCEGSTTLFPVDYFDRTAFLSQSGQLYGEAAAMALGKIYVFGPTFRAEKSKTRRHLTEFWMIEPEAAFWELPEVVDLAEALLCRLVATCLESCKSELNVLERDLAPLENVVPPFPRITYTRAVEILNQKGMDVQWGDDLGGDEETVLSKEFDRPLIVTHYPAAIKAFYMKRAPDNSATALAVDVLAPEGYGEIIGGGQREDSLFELENRIREQGLDPGPLGWYLDLRRYGSVPHSGFGLGVERTLAWIAGLRHVRETIAFPRLMDRLHP
jgi:asparaginyl-tRNA synthetase